GDGGAQLVRYDGENIGFEPARLLHVRNHRVQEVALRDDPDQPPVLVDDRQPPEGTRPDQLERFERARLLGHGVHRRRHHVAVPQRGGVTSRREGSSSTGAGGKDDAVTFRLAREFPRPDEASWIEYRHYNEKKLGKSRRADFPPFIGRLVDDLNAPEFVAWLSELTGIRGLVADPDLDGGGLHQTERGGFLNIHADFTMHHHRPS